MRATEPALENLDLLLSRDSQLATAVRSLGFDVMELDEKTGAVTARQITKHL
jgi:hypothetical protein